MTVCEEKGKVHLHVTGQRLHAVSRILKPLSYISNSDAILAYFGDLSHSRFVVTITTLFICHGFDIFHSLQTFYIWSFSKLPLFTSIRTYTSICHACNLLLIYKNGTVLLHLCNIQCIESKNCMNEKHIKVGIVCTKKNLMDGTAHTHTHTHTCRYKCPKLVHVYNYQLLLNEKWTWGRLIL